MKLRKLTALCLSFGLLCACGSSRDVPEIMPQQSYRAAEEASAQAHTAEVFQSAPAANAYPLTDTSTVLTLSYPLNNDFDLETSSFLPHGRRPPVSPLTQRPSPVRNTTPT